MPDLNVDQNQHLGEPQNSDQTYGWLQSYRISALIITDVKGGNSSWIQSVPTPKPEWRSR